MVHVGPETLHLDCTGAGDPTIVLESGLGGNYLDWTFVQPLLSRHFRTCSYDRAGMGFSAAPSRPRTLANLAEDLEGLLLAARIDGPIVLAGHSFGGLLAASFASTHAHRVKGLVLLDSMHPQQFSRFAEAGVEVSTNPVQVLGQTHPAAAAYGLPESLQRRAISIASENKVRKAVIWEMRAFPATLEEAGARGFNRVPTRVLMHGDTEWNQITPDGRMERAWTSMQEDLAKRLGAPPPLPIPGAGHQLPLDAPEIVAAAIAELAVAKAP
jgi:pimeloyl-ACP methyl ester carboxylesterase